MILENTITMVTYAFHQLRSRRKGGAPAQTAPNDSSCVTDKENVDYREGAASKKKKAAGQDATSGLTASSCSSGASDGGAIGTGRYQKQARKTVNRTGHSQSADLASVSSASGAGTSGVCDSITQTDFERLVALPVGMEPHEWMASQALALFNHVNALYGAISEFCTKEMCPVMNGPGGSQFLWIDEKNRKVKYPAPQHVDCVMSFAERTVRSEEMFPTKFGNDFPINFEIILKKLCRFLYQVLAHLHLAHWEHLRVLGVGSQAAAVHWHLAVFANHFQLLESKDAAGLAELTNNMRRLNIKDEGNMEEPIAMRLEEERELITCESPPRIREATVQLVQ